MEISKINSNVSFSAEQKKNKSRSVASTVLKIASANDPIDGVLGVAGEKIDKVCNNNEKLKNLGWFGTWALGTTYVLLNYKKAPLIERAVENVGGMFERIANSQAVKKAANKVKTIAEPAVEYVTKKASPIVEKIPKSVFEAGAEVKNVGATVFNKLGLTSVKDAFSRLSVIATALFAGKETADSIFGQKSLIREDSSDCIECDNDCEIA